MSGETRRSNKVTDPRTNRITRNDSNAGFNLQRAREEARNRARELRNTDGSKGDSGTPVDQGSGGNSKS